MSETLYVPKAQYEAKVAHLNERIAAAEELAKATRFMANYTMRDGTPCFCPAGQDECEPKGRMPTVHATGCEEVRIALAAYNALK